jgi:hypothetical protein
MGIIGDLLKLSITTKSQDEFIRELNKRNATSLIAIPTIEKENKLLMFQNIKILYISRIDNRRIYFTEYYNNIPLCDNPRFHYTVIKKLQHISGKIPSITEYSIGIMNKGKFYYRIGGRHNECIEFAEKHSELEPFEPESPKESTQKRENK